MPLLAGNLVQNAEALQVLYGGGHCGESRFDLLRGGSDGEDRMRLGVMVWA